MAYVMERIPPSRQLRQVFEGILEGYETE